MSQEGEGNKVNFGGKIEAVMRKDDWEEVKGKNCNNSVMNSWIKGEERKRQLSDERERLREGTCGCRISILGRNDKQLNAIEEA